jgi:hypothetical protein
MTTESAGLPAPALLDFDRGIFRSFSQPDSTENRSFPLSGFANIGAPKSRHVALERGENRR